MLSGAGFLDLEREIVLLGSAQILTGADATEARVREAQQTAEAQKSEESEDS